MRSASRSAPAGDRRLLPQPVGDAGAAALAVGVLLDEVGALLGEVDVALGDGWEDGVSDALGLDVAVGVPDVLGRSDGLAVEDFAG